MRADNDHAVGNSVESCCKDEPKPHQCPEEKWEDAELKIPENGKMNNNNVCELFYDTRSGDEWDKENDGNACGDSNEAGKKLRDAIGHDIDANGDSVEEADPVFYMDKNVTACDLPEIVVCFKDSTYHVVKDICVDEGVPVQEFLFGEKDSVKCSSDTNLSESEDLTKAEKVDSNGLETKSLEDGSEVCNDLKTSKDFEEHSREVFSDAEGSSICNQEHLIATREAKESHPSEISHDEDSKDDEVAATSLTLGDILSREDEQKPLKSDGPEEEQSLTQLQDKERRSFETELKETEELGKAEQKLSSVSTTPSQEPERTCNDPEKPETENQQQNNLAEQKLSSVSTKPSQEPDGTCNDPEKPETENQQQNNLVEGSNEDDKRLSSSFGETSFSAADVVSISGHITYSGPIAFSGSLSVRSDASTTSGRSFAFPILQSEWNSSPVRMKKAGKRRQKGWKHSLLCCRFS